MSYHNCRLSVLDDILQDYRFKRQIQTTTKATLFDVLRDNQQIRDMQMDVLKSASASFRQIMDERIKELSDRKSGALDKEFEESIKRRCDEHFKINDDRIKKMENNLMYLNVTGVIGTIAAATVGIYFASK